SKRADLTLTPHDPHRRRVIIAAIAGGVVLLVLVGLGLYGLLTGPDRAGTTPTQPGIPTSPATPAQAPSATPGELPTLPALPVTTSPDIYARAVAATVFTWDTADRFSPLDYASAVLAGADPSGEESAGLASDLALYLP